MKVTLDIDEIMQALDNFTADVLGVDNSEVEVTLKLIDERTGKPHYDDVNIKLLVVGETTTQQEKKDEN